MDGPEISSEAKYEKLHTLLLATGAAAKKKSSEPTERVQLRVQCDFCEKIFRSKKALFGHLRCHQRSFQCSDCSFLADNLRQFRKHQASHRQQSIHSCQQCHKVFQRNEILLDHIRQVHEKQKRFECSLCDKSFFRRHDLKQHLKLHLDIKNYSCEICGFRFSHVSNLKRHFVTHTKEKKFTCPHCDKSFSQSSSLEKHQKVHANFRVGCEVCSKTTGSFDSLRKHLKSLHGWDSDRIRAYVRRIKHHHEKSPSIEDVCNDDVSICETEACLSLPTESQDEPVKSASKSFICSICQKSFSRHSSLKQHLATHSPNQRIACDMCAMQFAWKTTLKRHLWNAHGIAKELAKCKSCRKTFPSKAKLKVHERRDHEGEKNHKCSECSKAFFRKDDLQTHMKCHRTEKLHKCEQCDKSFSHISNLHRHIKIHSGVKDFACIICKKQFTQKQAVLKHQRRCGHVSSGDS